MPADDMDLESMLNNPFRNLEPRNPAPSHPEPPLNTEPERPPEISGEVPRTRSGRMERNHPIDLRVLGLEKNEFNTGRKLEDIKQVIEHQNERIRLLEEELELLRNELRNRV
jgi:hypothetical protein